MSLFKGMSWPAVHVKAKWGLQLLRVHMENCTFKFFGNGRKCSFCFLMEKEICTDSAVGSEMKGSGV